MKITARVSLLLLTMSMLVFWSCAENHLAEPSLNATLTHLSQAGGNAEAHAQTAAPHWGYAEHAGPEHWCDLDESFRLCCEGASQTPIDLKPNVIHYAQLPKLQFGYRTADLDVVNNGHTLQANVPAGVGTLTIAGKVYTLLQFHWHWASEHAVNGRHLPMEMHLVHKAEDGTLAVVGVFIVAGKRHAELEEIWEELPAAEGDHRAVAHFRLHKLLPQALKSIRYQGSLTTPPCSENVNWNVLVEPLTMSPEQIQKFVALFSGAEFPHGNRRPVQPVNGRPVWTDVRP